MASSMADAFGKSAKFKDRAEAVKKEKKGKETTKNSAPFSSQNAKGQVNQKRNDNGSSNRYQNSVQPSGRQNYSPSFGRNANEATAPYNFIPLPDKAVPSPLGLALGEDKKQWAANYAQFIKEQGTHSGYIDITITTLTPVCINWDEKFYAPNGIPVIPGSTLRGMVKNYLKIISCGTMRAEGNEDLTSRHLYYRDIASPKGSSTLKKYYAQKMMISVIKEVDGEEKPFMETKASAGFLARLDDNSYVIYPADFKTIPYERETNPDGTFKFMLDRNGNKKYFYRVPYNIRYCYEKNGEKSENKEGAILPTKEYVDCHTGYMNGKGHFYRLSNVEWNKPLMVLPETIAEYKADKSHKGLNLFDPKRSIAKSDFAYGHHFTHLVPCFYLAEDNIVLHFGYGKYYRIPYDNSIEDHIPEGVKAEKIVDFAEAMFGSKENFAGRVFFEDAVCTDSNVQPMPSETSALLMEPRPTSFQLYLESRGGKAQHYDENTNIRGYKLYWHQNKGDDGWKLSNAKNQGNGNEKVQNKLSPVRSGVSFAGRIRFENLAAEELGGLLKILKYGTTGSRYFKIGMGKPIGMGSIQLKATLHVENLDDRYKTLFNNDQWQSGEDPVKAQDLIVSFDNYMAKQTGELKIVKDYEKLLAALNVMMSWDNRPDPDSLAYMPIGVKNDQRYKNRAVLPTPEEVLKGGK